MVSEIYKLFVFSTENRNIFSLVGSIYIIVLSLKYRLGIKISCFFYLWNILHVSLLFKSVIISFTNEIFYNGCGGMRKHFFVSMTAGERH